MRRLVSIALLALPLAVAAQHSALSEGEALRRGLARPELSDLNTAREDFARADAISAGLPPNPLLAYSRERGRGSSGAREDSWTLSQTFDLAGRRGLHREAADLRVEAARSDSLRRLEEWGAEIRLRFHEALFQQEVVRATEAWVARFRSIAATVERLARAGEASGYDRRRLARERQNAELRLTTARGEQDRATRRLASLIGHSGELPSLEGELQPAAPPPLAEGLLALERRTDLQVLARRAEAADVDGRAADRGWIPELTLGVGPKRTENEFGRETALMLEVSVPLPLFDRQQAERQRARAQALQTRGEYGLTLARAEGELRGLHRQLERLVAAAVDYRAAARSETPALLRIAEAAYRGGESSLLELLDAYRGALDTEIGALELDWKARQARIEYDLVSGSVRP